MVSALLLCHQSALCFLWPVFVRDLRVPCVSLLRAPAKPFSVKAGVWEWASQFTSAPSVSCASRLRLSCPSHRCELLHTHTHTLVNTKYIFYNLGDSSILHLKIHLSLLFLCVIILLIHNHKLHRESCFHSMHFMFPKRLSCYCLVAQVKHADVSARCGGFQPVWTCECVLPSTCMSVLVFWAIRAWCGWWTVQVWVWWAGCGPPGAMWRWDPFHTTPASGFKHRLSHPPICFSYILFSHLL